MRVGAGIDITTLLTPHSSGFLSEKRNDMAFGAVDNVANNTESGDSAFG